MKRDSVIRLIDMFHVELVQINRRNPKPLKREWVAKGLVIWLELFNQVVDELRGNPTVRLSCLVNCRPSKELTVARVPHVYWRKGVTGADLVV